MCTMHKIDTQKSEAFAENLIGMMNHGALALMTLIGHRTGFFDTMKDLPPSTSKQIANAAGLNERYVREWLGTMWGKQKALEMLGAAGFKNIEVEQLEHDFQNYYYIVLTEKDQRTILRLRSGCPHSRDRDMVSLSNHGAAEI